MTTERSNSPRDPAPTTVHDAPPLPNDVATLHAMIRELIDSLKKEQHEREGVQQRLDLLLRRLYGPKAERFDPNQPWLLPEVAPDADQVDPPAEPTVVESEPATSKPARPGHGRKPLPKDLPRRRREHTLPEAQRLHPHSGAVC